MTEKGLGSRDTGMEQSTARNGKKDLGRDIKEGTRNRKKGLGIERRNY